MCPDDAGVVEPEPSGEFDVAAAYDRHAAVLLRFAASSVSDTATAEDVVQETFLRAWRARDRYSADRGAERAWLFAIARNVVIDTYRSGARRPVPVGDETLDAATRTQPAPPSEMEAVEHRIVLLSALAQLSSEHRQVIAAVQVRGLTYQELSDSTGVPVRTLRTRMFYALRALRATLTEHEHDQHHGPEERRHA